jgi:hypothetical protein
MEKQKVFDTYAEYHKPTRVKDSHGHVKETYALHQKAMVCIERYAGGESAGADRIAWDGTFTILGHYISTVDITFRVKIDSDYWAIVDIEPLNRRRWMRLRVNKVVG